jgi:hypothetical protein
MAHTEESIAKELKRISLSIPENLRKNVVKEVPATPTVEFVMKKALELDTVSDEKKKQIKALLDRGDFSKMKTVENPRIGKMIDNYVGRQINKSIKEGRLPTKAQLKKMSHYKEIMKITNG